MLGKRSLKYTVFSQKRRLWYPYSYEYKDQQITFLKCWLRASDVVFSSDCAWCSSFFCFGGTAIQDHLNGSMSDRLQPLLSFLPILLPPPWPPHLPSLLVSFQGKATGASGCARKPAACSGFQPLLQLPLGCPRAKGCFMLACALQTGSENSASSHMMFNFQHRNLELQPGLDLPQSKSTWMNTGVTSDCKRNHVGPEPTQYSK